MPSSGQLAAVSVAQAAATWRRGALLVTGAVMVWSAAGPLARWVDTDPWTTLFWRSLFAWLSLAFYLAWRDGRALPDSFRRLGWSGTAMALCFAVSMICFIIALSLTTVAAVLIFQAASSLFAAGLAWVFLRERVSGAKLAAILASVAGVVVMVSGSGGPGRFWGNALSMVMSLCFAGTVVLARFRRDVPTTEASCLAVLLVALVSLPLAQLDVSSRDLALLALFGFGQMGLALVMFTAGVRLIPAADAGLISVLESVLAPLWVWFAFGENPGEATLLGGAVVVVAVIAAARWERRAT